MNWEDLQDMYRDLQPDIDSLKGWPQDDDPERNYRRENYMNAQPPNNDDWMTRFGGYLGVLPPSQQYGYGRGILDRGSEAIMDPMMRGAETVASAPGNLYNRLAALWQPRTDAVTMASPQKRDSWW